MLKSLIANPRTTAAGLAILVLVGLLAFQKITVEQFTGAFGALTASGLLAAKDA